MYFNNRDSKGKFARKINVNIPIAVTPANEVNVTQKCTKKKINHLCTVVDISGSTSTYMPSFRELVKKMAKDFYESSTRENQDVLVSLYVFSGRNYIKHLLLESGYNEVSFNNTVDSNLYARDSTALIDATIKSVEDVLHLATYNRDISYLFNIVTDGQENDSINNSIVLNNYFKVWDIRDDVTITISVPNEYCKKHARNFGFPEGNISVYQVSQKGIQEQAVLYANSTQSYVQNRSLGVKKTESYFTTNLNQFGKTELRSKLNELKPKDYQYLWNRTNNKVQIKDLVEAWNGANSYVIGSSYYELTKPEKIQAYKQILIVEKSTGKVLADSGNSKTRDLLGLPKYEVLVHPGDHGDYDIFVQSTAPNRNIIPQQRIIVLK